MSKYLVVLCTPNIYHPSALRSIKSLKNTNLEKAELVIVDNCYDSEFRHAETMQEYIQYADGKPIFFLDDDIVINDHDWIKKMVKCGQKTGSIIVGCCHTYPSGEINHKGILVYLDGSTELLREGVENLKTYYFVPAVSSAAILITDPKVLNFDTAFKKYQHDVDLCLSAWKKDLKVACTSELKIVHNLGGYVSSLDGFRDLFAADTYYLQQKWTKFVSSRFYQKREVAVYSKFAKGFNWEIFYNKASRLSISDPKKATLMFRKIVKDCPFKYRKAGALYHLYRLEGIKKDLQDCVRLNGFHQLATNELKRLETIGG